jgi:SNF2 family DNA or RNA helicase
MPVHIDIFKDRVTLKSGWYPGVESDCKSISGASWAPSRQQWSYPLTMQTLRRMRDVFGSNLKPSAAVNTWARDEARREKRLKGLASVHDSALLRVPSVAPILATATSTRKYQRSAARFAATAGSFALTDEPGLGKTATMLAALIEAGLWHGDVLIVAPLSSLSSVWERQIKMWTGNPYVVAMPEGAAQRRKAMDSYWDLDPEDEPRILVVNPAMLRRKYGHYCKRCNVWKEDNDNKRMKVTFPKSHHLEGHGVKRAVYSEDWPEILNNRWTAVVIDEAHTVLTSNTPSGIKTNMQTQGAVDVGKNTDHRFALTGTPLKGQEKNIWGIIDWLSGSTLGGYWNFIDEYFEVANNGFGKEIRGVDPARRAELESMLDRWVLRRTRAEVRPELPLGQRNYVKLDMTKRQRAQYEEFEFMGETMLDSGSVSGQGVLSEMTRLRQMSYGVWRNDGSGHLTATEESPVLEYIVEFLRARGITGTKTGDWLPEPGVAYKYVIGSQFTEVLDAIERGLHKKKIRTIRIDGSVNLKARTALTARFQSDDKLDRVMLIQTQTGGVAIELDAWCDEMVICDETFIADEQVQLEGRINNRSGRVAPRMWHYVVMMDTIAQRISSENVDQHRLQHELLDGRRGVKKALHLLRGN